MTWDEYFLSLCNCVASNSKCRSRQIGAIIVRDKSIVSTGYNGPPRGVPPCGDVCPRQSIGYRSGEGLHLCVAAHAETNAIANAARLGVTTNGATLYLNTVYPCKNCMGLIINAGIVEVVATASTYYDEKTIWIVEQSGIKLRTFGN